MLFRTNSDYDQNFVKDSYNLSLITKQKLVIYSLYVLPRKKKVTKENIDHFSTYLGNIRCKFSVRAFVKRECPRFIHNRILRNRKNLKIFRIARTLFIQKSLSNRFLASMTLMHATHLKTLFEKFL